MDFTSTSSIILYIIFAAALGGIVYLRIKNKHTFQIEQSRLKNIQRLKEHNFCLQNITRVFYKDKEDIAVYFDNANKCFAVETIDYKNKKARIEGIFPFARIIGAALIENREIINQNNLIPGVEIRKLYAVNGGADKKRKVKANHVNSIAIKLIFDGINKAYLNIGILSHNIKSNDENYLYYSQIAQELYDIFEKALLSNWVEKENIVIEEAEDQTEQAPRIEPKVEKSYQDKLWELNNYRQKGIVSELMNYSKKIRDED